MNEKIISLMGEINAKVSEISDLVELDKIRVAYLGKKGSITALLKGMKDLSPDEKKAFGSEVNQLKAMASEKIEQKIGFFIFHRKFVDVIFYKIVQIKMRKIFLFQCNSIFFFDEMFNIFFVFDV